MDCSISLKDYLDLTDKFSFVVEQWGKRNIPVFKLHFAKESAWANSRRNTSKTQWWRWYLFIAHNLINRRQINCRCLSTLLLLVR